MQKQNGKAKEQLPDPNCWTNFRVSIFIFDVSVCSLRKDTMNPLGRLNLDILLSSGYIGGMSGDIH